MEYIIELECEVSGMNLKLKILYSTLMRSNNILCYIFSGSDIASFMFPENCGGESNKYTGITATDVLNLFFFLKSATILIM